MYVGMYIYIYICIHIPYNECIAEHKRKDSWTTPGPRVGLLMLTRLRESLGFRKWKVSRADPLDHHCLQISFRSDVTQHLAPKKTLWIR